jgi:DME family drug/metabolite transporter
LLVLAAAVLWGTSGTAQALAPASATSAVVGTARIMLSGLVLILFAAFEGRLRPWRSFLRPIFLLTGLMQALFQITYFGGIAYTGVAVGTMVAIGSCPIYAGILGVVLDKEKLSRRWLWATAIALTGLLILMLDDGAKVQVDVRGLLLALAAGFSYTFFTWMARRLIKTMPVDAVMAVSFLVGSVFLLPVLFLEPLEWIGTPRGISVVLYLGVISAGLAYMLYGRGLRTVPVSAVGTLTLAEPLTAALLGIFFLGELLSLASAAGIVLIFTAQLVLVLPSYAALRRTLGTKRP